MFFSALCVEPFAAGLVFFDPALRVGAVLNFFQDLAHGLAGFFRDDARTAGVVAVLGGVADGIAHVVQAAAVDEIDDQLEFVEAFEVGDLGLVTGFHQGFETSFDQGADATAQNRLFAE